MNLTKSLLNWSRGTTRDEANVKIKNTLIQICILIVITVIILNSVEGKSDGYCREGAIKCSEVKANCKKLTVNCQENKKGEEERCLKIKARCSLFRTKCLKMRSQCMEARVKVCNEQDCRMNNQSILCSERGICECGECRCNVPENNEQRIWGQYCECDNFNCPHHNGWICSGSECDCGTCHCDPGRFGLACELVDTSKYDTFEPTDIDKSCREFGRGPVCSDQGKCVGGQCHCKENYVGEFCEKCLNCRKHHCTKYKDCVHCILTTQNDTESCNCSFPLLLDMVDVVKMDQENDDYYCHQLDSNKCRYYFVLGHNVSTNVYARVQKSMDCPVSFVDKKSHPGSTFYWILVGVFLLGVIVGVLFYMGVRCRRKYGIWIVSN